MIRSAKTRANTFFRTFTTTNPLTPTSIDPQTHHSNDLLERLRVLCTRGHLEEAVSLFYTLDQAVPRPHQTYATLFHACATHKRLRLGQALHHHMVAHSPNIPPDLYLTNHLINMYAKCSDLVNAHKLFDEMPQRNIISWTILVSGYAQHGRSSECFNVFAGMLAHFRPTEFAYASVLTSCEFDCGRQVHTLALKTSFDGYVFVANALITMYSNGCDCGVYGEGKDEAWMVFRDMSFRNLVTWNSMIAGFQIRGLGAQAVSLFVLMHRDRIGFDRATLVSMFSSFCGDSGGVFTLDLKHCFQLHCLVIKTGFFMEVGVATALVKAYSNLSVEATDCYNVFLEMSGGRDIVSWTSIMAILAERRPEEALFLFHQFRQDGLAPDSYVFSVVIKACAGLATPRSTLAVHSLVVKAGFEDDVVVANALLHAYARSDSIGSAKLVFDEMDFRDTVSWNSLLKAYSLHGQAKEAMQLFGQMNVQPDAATYVALLSACSHAGLVEEGMEIFDSMFENYGIVPQLDHFACMVDILGRAGRILEAYKLISNMPIEPDYVVWSAFLGACRKHGESNLANIAVTKLKELDPENSLGYVLMSNIYCSARWIEVGNCVYEFASGGRRHPHGEAVRASLEKLVGKLKGLGFVPETNLALHDVEEEQKEEQLYYHSEKLALVFALMNSSGSHCSGGVIRIMKNIRICVDCHNFIKVTSKLVQREIVVRDSNRFHHFKEGVCSCKDYW
ncbi:tetratricopeptide repeat (TPR)-like superfamily protein [Actinidia rufa]|uniref:Tetratricopeptide repeat (TPR)-like superfamily protein n=1 Tax=Actinidia rufa TaxID=165716 RepID=A0A7J0FF34_9ERIC|nr:tetratricopeptide repeat (TPR)-like superfamily protein [Actinidia rufa]